MSVILDKLIVQLHCHIVVLRNSEIESWRWEKHKKWGWIVL